MSSKYVKFPIILLCLLALAIPTNAQSAPSEAGIPPYPGAPLCPTHNDIAWHGLWDDVRGCHYDHTHNDDPALGNSVFGAAGQAWGQNVSYPWMTAYENDIKGHPGYKYYVNLAPSPYCAQESYDYLIQQGQTLNCVSAFRMQYHDAGGNAHFTKRFHSYYMEVQIKSRNGNTTGIIRTGGWADYGCYHRSYKDGFFIQVPGVDPVNSSGQSLCSSSGQGSNADPYRAYDDTWAEIQNGIGNDDNVSIWTSHNRYGYNQFGYFFFRVMDTFGSVDSANPYVEHYLCGGNTYNPVNCKYNNSEDHVFNVFMMIPSSLDAQDGITDGKVTYTGYTDIKGNIVTNCIVPSANCVPLSIVNAPVGIAIWSRNLTTPGNMASSGEPPHDGDIYFNGQPSGWIQFQSQAQNPVPTNTPASSGPYVSTEVNPTSLNIGGSALVNVRLNNVPVEGYKSAEFTCTYNASLVEKSNIVATNLFGADAVVAIHDVQNGTFIVAIAGTNSNRATTSGPAFTFSVKGLQAGQSAMQCTARVSKGDNLPLDLSSTGTSLTILGVEPSPIPFSSPTLIPDASPQPTTTNAPLESPTPTTTFTPLPSPTATPSPNGSLNGQVIAGKPVTVSLVDANNVQISSVVANPDGTFSLTALAGNYTVVAMASGFLSHQGAVVITAGNTTGRPTISLLAGDIDGNNIIDQFDALTIGMSYNTVTPSAADLNNDGIINFLDLELLAENYRTTGPSAW